MQRIKDWLTNGVFGGWTCFVLIALYAPFIIMFILSFNSLTGGTTFPLRGVGVGWWHSLWDPTIIAKVSGTGGGFTGTYWGGLWRSFVLGLMVMGISTVLATLAAQAFRKRFRGSSFLFYMFLLGIILPGLVVSLGLSLACRALGIPLAWYGTTLFVHVVWTFPFCFLIMLVFFNRFDRTLEDAALSLGANEYKTFFRVTLPLVAPGILASCLFGFTLSFDEMIRSLLVTGPENTLPLLVWGTLQIRVTPRLYAIGSLTTLISFCIVIFYFIMSKRMMIRQVELEVKPI
jgi:putative spermidine/putrescine transport system permease protein